MGLRMASTRTRVLACVLTLFGLLSAENASAVTLVSPRDGGFTTSTPTFTWQLDPGEESFIIEITPNPALGGDAGFAEDEELRSDLLDEQQTSYSVGNADPLFGGTWYWHVKVVVEQPSYDSYWSATRSFHVPDEEIRLHSFQVDYLACIQEVTLEFEYSDNSRDQFARWRLDFLKRRGGHSVARRRGSVDESDFGSFSHSFERPAELQIGRRYFAQLRLKDREGHVTGSRPKRLPIRHC